MICSETTFNVKMNVDVKVILTTSTFDILLLERPSTLRQWTYDIRHLHSPTRKFNPKFLCQYKHMLLWIFFFYRDLRAPTGNSFI
uniref:Ovule protein n=1 Tax=Steinernema glaseri TaxID=37863 RepID=A0A1I7YA95_9BILA